MERRKERGRRGRKAVEGEVRREPKERKDGEEKVEEEG